ncbi:phage Gp37/Gp68 family protein [Nostoc sp. CHAB 5844]|nr:phage Gp37/Gp68 family protein [Nostoc sp. CHAB 5844]
MTNIQWTDETWNPIVGCSRISPGCTNCYAATAAASARLQQFPQYQKVKDWDGTVEFVESQLLKPLSLKKPKKIFVCSMSDLFHENVLDEWRDRVFAIMALCQQHIFQVLTKRPHRALSYFTRENRFAFIDYQAYEILRNGRDEYHREHPVVKLPLKNCWIGTTTENQAMADLRIPILLKIPAAVRWLSVEPLLSEIDLTRITEDSDVPYTINCLTGEESYSGSRRKGIVPPVNWVVVGGESGKNARPCAVSWLRSAVQQCQSADIPVFVKQLGSNCCTLPGLSFGYSDSKGGKIEEFPEDLRIRQFPSR